MFNFKKIILASGIFIFLITPWQNLSAGIFPKLLNFGEVLPSVYRGGMPGPRNCAFQYLAQLGVKHIVNLDNIYENSRTLCEDYNMHCVSFPINAFSPSAVLNKKFPLNNIDKALHYIVAARERGEGVYFHCNWGYDRTGVLAAALQVREFACNNPNYSVSELRENILREWNSHAGFTTKLFWSGAKEEVLSWAENPPAWICRD